MIEAFPKLQIEVSDGNTVSSIDFLPAKTFVDIGSGNILKVSWNTPTATNNTVDSYKIYILRHDTSSASYRTLYSADIGNVNEFYVKSDLFASISQSFNQLRIYVEAISKYGAAYNGTSNTISVNVSKGSGNYIKVTDGYSKPVMKRAIAFTKLNKVALTDSSGKAVTDASGKIIYTKVSNVQDDETGWTVMQAAYSKDTTGTWQKSDITYEVLTDTNGEIVTDVSGSPVYTL